MNSLKKITFEYLKEDYNKLQIIILKLIILQGIIIFQHENIQLINKI